MPNTIGYHLVKSGYGLWLPGDDRGSWSEAWDAQIGYIEPHTLHPGDPIRQRMAEERMAHPPFRLSAAMIDVIIETIGGCVKKASGGLRIAAAAIEATHLHLAIFYSGRDIDGTAKWLADQTTKAIHRRSDHRGPVWCKGRWRSFVFEEEKWLAVIAYIERHNMRRGLPARPFSFLCPL
jgi:hypothetical protein